MKRMWKPILLGAVCVGFPTPASAQYFASTGSRASGMGGAFVAVADDASALYWNPAGLAAGASFSLAIDSGGSEAVPSELPAGRDGRSFLIALTSPAMGLGYYRLQSTSAVVPIALVPIDSTVPSRNVTTTGPVRVDSLVTHHAGFTLVQSLFPGVSVGTTLKLVRGIAASQLVPAETPEAALESDEADLLGRASNKFDLDIGVMAAGGPLKVGLTVRNVTEPDFEVAGDDGIELTLQRQARAGLSYAVGPNWLLSSDFDLLRITDAFGERRDAAFGVEGRLGTRVWVRSGFRVNTAAEKAFVDGRGHAYSVGGSYAARGAVWIDGFYSTGNESSGRQWGFGSRIVY